MCVCVFTCVFMETAVPFRYIVEVHAVQKSEQEDGETGRAVQLGIYHCSVARGKSQEFLISRGRKAN